MLEPHLQVLDRDDVDQSLVAFHRPVPSAAMARVSAPGVGQINLARSLASLAEAPGMVAGRIRLWTIASGPRGERADKRGLVAGRDGQNSRSDNGRAAGSAGRTGSGVGPGGAGAGARPAGGGRLSRRWCRSAPAARPGSTTWRGAPSAGWSTSGAGRPACAASPKPRTGRSRTCATSGAGRGPSASCSRTGSIHAVNGSGAFRQAGPDRELRSVFEPLPRALHGGGAARRRDPRLRRPEGEARQPRAGGIGRAGDHGRGDGGAGLERGGLRLGRRPRDARRAARALRRRDRRRGLRRRPSEPDGRGHV